MTSATLPVQTLAASADAAAGTADQGTLAGLFTDFHLFSISLSDVLGALGLLVLCLLAIKVLLRIVERSFDRLHVDHSLRAFVRSGIKLLLYFVTLLIVADSLGIPVTSLIAMLSVVGLAVSLAVQGALTNLAGGVLLLTTKPFAVGDYVEAGGVGGTVGEIGLFYTQLITPDNKVIYTPNGEISSGKIQNYNANPTRRVELTVSATSSGSSRIRIVYSITIVFSESLPLHLPQALHPDVAQVPVDVDDDGDCDGRFGGADADGE